ncbi:hypothetical protein [Actinokineospora sp. UTMC 2448]|uniref:hypothetical protein n=1 Tax=Actinokineospora sp. UTMC 2448 TaxID=2268449 RepID=UPI002164E5DF|nr:hypothetical protein [Actinokineospora sp. UTMC 2448]UVS79770.1 hypothetical protein Actkin_03520 [Actinokineospora sp. UTMC 2448]
MLDLAVAAIVAEVPLPSADLPGMDTPRPIRPHRLRLPTLPGLGYLLAGLGG